MARRKRTTGDNTLKDGQVPDDLLALVPDLDLVAHEDHADPIILMGAFDAADTAHPGDGLLTDSRHPIEDAEEDKEHEEDENHAFDKNEDEDFNILGMYMRDVGTVPVLEPDQEVEVFRRIQKNLDDLLTEMAGLPFVIEAAIAMGDSIRQNKINLSELVVGVDNGTVATSNASAVETEETATTKQAVLRRFDALRARYEQSRLALAPEKWETPSHKKTREKLVKAFKEIRFSHKAIKTLVETVKKQVEQQAQCTAHFDRLKAAHERITKIDAMLSADYSKMVSANLRLVISIAKKYNANSCMQFADLIQEGNIGLMKAIERFQLQHGCKFSTYATWWITESITRAICNRSRTIRVPEHVINVLRRASRLGEQYRLETGKTPSTRLLAEKMGVAEEKIIEAQRITREPVSLSTPIGNKDNDLCIGDLIEDTSPPPDNVVLNARLREQLGKIIDRVLSRRESKVIRMRYGIGTRKELTLDEVSKIMGITREGVRQIELRAFYKLRKSIYSKSLRAMLE